MQRHFRPVRCWHHSCYSRQKLNQMSRVPYQSWDDYSRSDQRAQSKRWPLNCAEVWEDIRGRELCHVWEGPSCRLKSRTETSIGLIDLRQEINCVKYGSCWPRCDCTIRCVSKDTKFFIEYFVITHSSNCWLEKTKTVFNRYVRAWSAHASKNLKHNYENRRLEFKIVPTWLQSLMEYAE